MVKFIRRLDVLIARQRPAVSILSHGQNNVFVVGILRSYLFAAWLPDGVGQFPATVVSLVINSNCSGGAFASVNKAASAAVTDLKSSVLVTLLMIKAAY